MKKALAVSASSYSAGVGRLLILFSLCLACVLARGQNPPSQAGGKLISSTPFSAKDLRVTRLDSSTTNVLKLRFQNTNVSAPDNGRTRTESYMVAGAPGALPSLTITGSKLVQFSGENAVKSELQPPENLEANLARMSELGTFRQFHLYTLSLSLSSPGALGQQWVVEELEVEIKLGEPRGGRPVPAWFKPVVDPAGSTIFSDMILNPDIDAAFYIHNDEAAADDRSSWTRMLNQYAGANRAARLEVYGEGIFHIGKAELEQAGLNVSAPAGSWLVYHNGKEVPAIADLDSAGNGILVPVNPLAGDVSPHRVFYLFVPEGSGTAAKRITGSSGAATQLDRLITTGAFQLSRMNYTDYHPKIRTQGVAGKWFWAEVGPGRAAELDYEMPAYFAPAAATDLRLTMFYGFGHFTQPTGVTVYVNGQQAGETTATSQQGSATFAVDAKLFNPGKNTLVLQLSAVGGPAMVVQNIDATWTQPLPPLRQANGFFASASSTGTHGLQFPPEPGKWAGIVSYRGGEWALLPQVAPARFADNGSSELYHVVSRETASTFTKVTAAKSLAAPDLTGTDYLLIAGEQLLESSRKLAQWHSDRGLKAAVLNVEDIFATYAYGHRDPRAIRNFLRHAYYGKAGAGRLSYVALVGEASDYRANPADLPDVIMPNIIPTAMAENPDAMPGDHQYAASLGSDHMEDFVIGRLPVSSPEEMDGVVNKIISYATRAPAEWSGRTEFVLDDNEEFPVVATSIMAQSFAPPLQAKLFKQWDFPYTINLRVNGMRRSHEATAALIDMFNTGVGFLNFFGHGGPNLWSHERLLHLSDMSLLHNHDKLPLITCASCDSAWINYPMPPVNVSMGEAMVTKPDGGGIGLFGPVAGASPFEHSILVERMMEGVSRIGLRRMGDITLYSKNAYFAESRSSSIPDQYLLLGDPALSLNLPEISSDIKHGGRDLVAGKLSGLAFSVPYATGTATVQSLQTGDVIATGPIKAGRASMQIKAQEPGSVALIARDDATTMVAGAELRVVPNLLTQTAVVPQILHQGGAVQLQPAVPFVAGDQLTSAENVTFNFTATAETTVPTAVIARLYRKGAVVGESATMSLGRAGSTQVLGVSTRESLSEPAEELQLKLSTTDGSTSAADIAFLSFRVPVTPPADLAWIPGSARAESWGDKFTMRDTVFLKGKLVNMGKAVAKNVVVTATENNPTTGTELGTINSMTSEKIGDILPGEAVDVNYRWEQANSPGTKTVYLVANKSGTLRELNMDNNAIEVPPFEIKLVGNITIGPVSWTPQFVRTGSEVEIGAVIFDDHPTTRGPLSYEIGFRNSMTRETSAVEALLPSTGPETTVSAKLALPQGFNQVYVSANSTKELEELVLGDSTAISPVMAIAPLQDAGEGKFATDLAMAEMWNLIPVGNNRLRMVGIVTSSTTMIPFESGYTSTGSVTAVADPADNLWTLSSWQLSSNPNEQPGEVLVRMPAVGITAGMPIRITPIGVVTGADQTVEFDVKQPGDAEWRTIRLAEKTPDGKVSESMGTFYGSDNAVELMFRAHPGKGVMLQALTIVSLGVEHQTVA